MILFSHTDGTLLKRGTVQQSVRFFFLISYLLGLLGIFVMCLFVSFLIISHNYWHGSSFKVTLFFNFLFPDICIIIIIIIIIIISYNFCFIYVV